MTTKRTVEMVGHRLLLKLSDDVCKNKTDWGFELDVGDTFKREKASAVIGTVISVGPMCWKAFDGNHPEWKPWAKPGDVVYFAKYAGKFITINDEDYLIINDEDVQGIVHDEEIDDD